jgi:hypothetical protein
VSREEGLLVELRGDDYGIKGLAAAAYMWEVSGRSGVCQEKVTGLDEKGREVGGISLRYPCAVQAAA